MLYIINIYYRVENSIQYSVMMYMRKESKKEQMYVLGWLAQYMYN